MSKQIFVKLMLFFCFIFASFGTYAAMLARPKYIEKISKNNFDVTVENIKSTILSKNNTIFSIVDHKENADGVNLELRKTLVITFGNPKVGTLLMQENQKIANELPLRITIFEDKNGKTRILYPNVKLWEKEYKIKKVMILNNISTFLEHLVK